MKAIIKYVGYIVIAIILFLIGWNFVAPVFNNTVTKEVVKHTVDTVWTKPDTVIQIEQQTITKWKAAIDTVYIDSTAVLVAKADTTISNDSLSFSVKYFFPPLNYFDVNYDLKLTTITDTVTILDSTFVEVTKPILKDNWFWVSAVLMIVYLLGNT